MAEPGAEWLFEACGDADTDALLIPKLWFTPAGSMTSAGETVEDRQECLVEDGPWCTEVGCLAQVVLGSDNGERPDVYCLPAE